MKDKGWKRRMYRALAGFSVHEAEPILGLDGTGPLLATDQEAQTAPGGALYWRDGEENLGDMRATISRGMYRGHEGDRFFSAELAHKGESEAQFDPSVHRGEQETFENYVVRVVLYFSRSVPSLLGWVQNEEIINIDPVHGYRLVVDEDEEFHVSVAQYLTGHTYPPLPCYYVRTVPEQRQAVVTCTIL